MLYKDEVAVHKIKDITARCMHGGYMTREVHMYSFKETVAEVLERWKDYETYTAESRAIIRREVRRFEKTLTYWERIDTEGVELVGDYGGKIKVLPEEVEVLVNTGIFKRAEVEEKSNDK
jgi:hypothetical protein